MKKIARSHLFEVGQQKSIKSYFKPRLLPQRLIIASFRQIASKISPCAECNLKMQLKSAAFSVRHRKYHFPNINWICTPQQLLHFWGNTWETATYFVTLIVSVKTKVQRQGVGCLPPKLRSSLPGCQTLTSG